MTNAVNIERLEAGKVINTVIATVEFATANYPAGSWRVAAVQPEVPKASADPRLLWLDVGPFYDRFGADALAIAASNHGACKAVQTLTGVRKYIDLADPRIGAMIDMLIATAQPAAAAFAPGSGPMTAAKKAAILNPVTTEHERHVRGLRP